MKKRNLIIITVASVFTLIFVLSSAWAGSPRHYRWDGAAIGVPAAVVGGVLMTNWLYSRPPTRVVYRYAGPYRHGFYYSPRWHRKHWEVRKRWLRNRPCRRWHSGHYHHYGR